MTTRRHVVHHQRWGAQLGGCVREWQILGFATMKIDGEALEMEYRDEFGKKVFSYTQPRRVKPQRSARV